MQPVADYYLSVHSGVVAGPVDALLQVYIGEKAILGGTAGFFGSGSQAATTKAQILGGVAIRQETQTSFSVKKSELFGGVKKEGGAVGTLDFLPGHATQSFPSYLASKFGLTPDTMPAFRGLTSLFFHGFGTGGFKWGSNTPYLKPVWAAVSRVPSHWYPERAKIAREEGTKRSVYIAMDASGSMNEIDDGGTKTRFQIAKEALIVVLDRIKSSLPQGFEIDIAINFWSFTSQTIKRYAVTDEGIEQIKSWVNSRAITGGTDFNYAVNDATNWWSAIAGQDYAKRAYIFVTDGEPFPESSAATAAATVGGAAWAGVDRYGININLPNTTYTAMLDNTSEDGVPVVSGSDSSGLIAAIETALYPDDVAPDANPAHIIHECLTNGDWGMGGSTTMIDDAAFRAAADTLFGERFGLTMMWVQQVTIEDFIREVLDHIDATLFVKPSTGLLTLKLIRDDYDPETIPVLNDDNCVITNFQRRPLSETFNEINGTWVNPLTEEEETLTIQDLANITMQGGPVTDSRNYYGVRRRGLCQMLINRDIRAASAPLATATVEVDRTAWDFVPGDVFKLEQREHGIVQQIVMRIGPIDYGKPGSSTIKLNVIEDVFSQPTADFEEAPGSAWEDPTAAPSVLAYSSLFTMPYIFGAVTDPDVYVATLGAQTGLDTLTYELVGYVTDAAGNTDIASLGTKDIVSRATLATALDAEATTAISSFTGMTQGTTLGSGTIMVIGGGTEAERELALITGYVNPNYSVTRGALDTVPRAWPAGTPVWFFNQTQRVYDNTVRAAFETVEYKMLPRTSLGLLDEAAAPWLEVTLTDRPHLPSRPADVKVNGVGYGPVDVIGLDPIPVTWANRNRVTEDSVILAWDAASVTPEAGQTTKIEAFTDAGVLVETYSGLTGTSHDIVLSTLGANDAVDLKFTAERDGLESLQGHVIRVLLQPAPQFSVQPSISGGFTVGDTLTGDPGTVDKGTLSYQWFSDGVEIVGETGLTYTTTASDDGLLITFAVTADSGGNTTTATSAPHGPIGADLPYNITPPTIHIV